MAQDLPVAKGLVPFAGLARRGVEVPGNDEGDGASGKTAGLLVPRSKSGHLVKELLGLNRAWERAGARGKIGGGDVI